MYFELLSPPTFLFGGKSRFLLKKEPVHFDPICLQGMDRRPAMFRAPVPSELPPDSARQQPSGVPVCAPPSGTGAASGGKSGTSWGAQDDVAVLCTALPARELFRFALRDRAIGGQGLGCDDGNCRAMCTHFFGVLYKFNAILGVSKQ